MNLVAHQILSFNNEKIQVGNFLGEFIRGKKYEEYEREIAIGIKLHRSIDTFTDSNELVSEACSYFRKTHRKFSPIIVDVLFDYFLIQNWKKFRNDSFLDFIDSSYSILKRHSDIYPENVKEYLGYMISENWFYRYSSLEGVEFTLKQISKRSTFSNNIENSIKEVYLYEKELSLLFLEFFPILENHCLTFLKSKKIF